MKQSRVYGRAFFASVPLLVTIGCSASDAGTDTGSGGREGTGGASTTQGGGNSSKGGGASSGGSAQGGGMSQAGGTSNNSSGGQTGVGGSNMGGTATGTGGTSAGGATSGGTSTTSGGTATGGTATGGTTTAGASSGGKSAAGGAAMGGKAATGGTSAGGTTSGSGGTSTGSGGSGNAPGCTATGYNATMIKSGSTWTVTAGGSQKYSGSDTQAALTAAYNSLTSGRTAKQSILVQGDGDIPATAKVRMPSYTIVNWCSGTLNISGSASGDYSPFYAQGATDVEIANLAMTGSPSYGIFFRGTSNMTLGTISLKLTGGSPGIGIRIDTSGSAGTDTTFVKNLKVGSVTGSGMSSHILETYGVDGCTIGTISGNSVGECGLLFNRSINCTVDTVTCTDCGKGTGYAAFRVANSVGKIGSDWPAGNIHVGKVYARGGGRGIFSVSGCGGLTIDSIDIANTGNTSILLQNTYNTTMAAVSGTVSGGLVQISNDTNNTNSGTYAPSKNVALKNLTLTGGASVRQDWCSQYGANGCTATNITGGTVSMCQ